MAVLGAGAGTWAATRPDGTVVGSRSFVATAAVAAAERTVSATGTINAGQTAELNFAVSGLVTSVKVAVGDKVTKGQTLARIDDEALERAVEIARANRDAAAAQLDAARDAEASDTQITSAQAQLATAEDKLAAAKDDLAAAKLTAPISGTVASVDLAVGERVGSSTGSSGGTPPGGTGGGTSSGTTSTAAGIVLVDTAEFVVDAAVGGADLASIAKGQQVRITPTGASEPVFGIVESVGVVASTSSGGASTFPVRIDVTGTPAGLHPGAAAGVTIVTESVPDVLTVPTPALRQENGATVVTKVVDGRRETVRVATGAVYAAGTEITSGLVAGDQIEVTVNVPSGGTRGGGNRPAGGFPAGGSPSGGFPAGGFPAGGFSGGGFTGGAR